MTEKQTPSGFGVPLTVAQAQSSQQADAAIPRLNQEMDKRREELLKMQIGYLLDAYKFHQDLFLKWVGLYIAVAGGVAVYVFNESPSFPERARQWIPAGIGAASLVLTFGCCTMWMGLKKLENELALIHQELKLRSTFLAGGHYLVVCMLIVTLGFTIASLVFTLFWDFFTKP